MEVPTRLVQRDHGTGAEYVAVMDKSDKTSRTITNTYFSSHIDSKYDLHIFVVADEEVIGSAIGYVVRKYNQYK